MCESSVKSLSSLAAAQSERTSKKEKKRKRKRIEIFNLIHKDYFFSFFDPFLYPTASDIVISFTASNSAVRFFWDLPRTAPFHVCPIHFVFKFNAVPPYFHASDPNAMRILQREFRMPEV